MMEFLTPGGGPYTFGWRDALDILIEKGRVGADEDLNVVVLTGDGSAYGMGLSATSAAIERDLDFLYLCYDNEGYANTGQQTSAATPRAARTATDAGGAGAPGRKKDLFGIWIAHRPVYAATVIGSEPGPPVMMGVALLALVANATCLGLIARHRHGGAHMKASYIFSANDVLANVGVIVAGALVGWTGSRVPDLVVGTAIAFVVLLGAVRILRLR